MPEPERTVNLQEWRDTFLSSVTLSVRDRRLADTLDGVEIREMRDGLYIKASSWVGVVQFEAFTLRIAPKLTNIDIVRMLMVGGGFDRLQHYQAGRDYRLEGDISLFDLIAQLLVDACMLVERDGLLQGYVIEEDDLPVMRGRLLVAEQIRRRYGQVNRLECRYDDHHADVVDNQILYTALTLCRRYVRHPLIQRRVQQLTDIFGAACGLLSGDWREVRADMTYNRLNTRYQEAHTLAWIVMEGLGIRDVLASGTVHGFAFLMDMNPLFEEFIRVLIKTVMSGDDFTLPRKTNSRGHIWDLGRNRTYSDIIPDLLLEKSSGERLAIDAKYKRYDDFKLAQSDIYQVFLYAYAFRDAGGKLPSALLLYPAETNMKNHTRLHVRDGQGYTQARLHALGIDIPHALNGMMGKDDEGVFEQVRGAIQSLLE